MSCIRIEHLEKRFDDTLVLKDVSLTIRQGELFFLLGSSGCGKTTLLRLLAGFMKPDKGHIFFGDKEVSKVPPYKRKTGMVFQNYALWPHMTVEQNVAFGLQQMKLPTAEIKQRVAEALISVKMDAYAHRRPNALSGGQQQRVALARALVVRPHCLLLDEPLSNLDAKLRIDMRAEIRRICKEFQVTTIYVTHDQTEALSIADRMAVFSKGHLEQVGTPWELYKRPCNRFVAHFLGATNFLSGIVLPYEPVQAFLMPDNDFADVDPAAFELAEPHSGSVLPRTDAPSEAIASNGMQAMGDCGEKQPLSKPVASQVLVQTALGPYRGLWHAEKPLPPVGTRVLLSIRPEALHLQPMPLSENSTDGVIENVLYYGEVAHYAFVKAGVTLCISELNPKHWDRKIHQKWFAHVQTEDVVVLPWEAA